MRFALGVDDDLGEFYRRFRRDPLLGPLIRRCPSFRPRRRPWPWEALAWAVVEQLIEAEPRGARSSAASSAAGARGWARGARPCATSRRRRRSPAAPRPNWSRWTWRRTGRSALRRSPARSPPAAAGSSAPRADRRLLAIREIGPWTVQCLGLFGRGELDSLPAGDLGYIKLVGRLAGLGRRATVAEVEEFYAPYEPFRGLAGR